MTKHEKELRKALFGERDKLMKVFDKHMGKAIAIEVKKGHDNEVLKLLNIIRTAVNVLEIAS